MGLDIYYHRVKHPEYYKQYSRAVDAFGDFENRYSMTHRAEIEASFKVWSDWHDKYCESNVDYDEWIKTNPEPHYDIWDYLTKSEKAEKQILSDEISKYRNATGFEQDEIEALYMRKMNWMVSFVQERHPELLTNDKSYGLILEDGEAILSVEDIEELINRMDSILSNWQDFAGERDDTSEYETHFQKLMVEHKELAAKLLPTCARFFFGSTDYDWWYYTKLHYYRDEFKKELALMKEDGHALIYMESW